MTLAAKCLIGFVGITIILVVLGFVDLLMDCRRSRRDMEDE